MSLRKFISILSTVVALSVWQSASAALKTDKYHEEIVEMSVEENLIHPEVPRKQIKAVKERQLAMARHLKQKGLMVETARDGMAVILTLGTDGMFLPNDTLLTAAGIRQVEQLEHYLKTPDFYKVLVVVHSDDTGSESYLNALTASRAEEIVRHFASKGLLTDAVIPYGFGMDEPLTDNLSRSSRAANRRVEFYFIPGPALISAARSGKL
ncbi:MAG: OmpA family protein [Muribaculaceae bacterium]|nr:OmpA family protein [Muribaculaceae bacterium]